MIHVFKGWIPTVSGRLSFSTFGETDHPNPAISANRGHDQKGFIVCYQARVTLDTLLPKKAFLSPYFFGLSGRMWFLCVAESLPEKEHPEETLEGDIFIFHDKKIWRDDVQEFTRELQRRLKGYSDATGMSLERFFSPKAEQLKQLASQYASFAVSFSLKRSGAARFEFDDQSSFHEGAPKFPNDPDKKARLVKMVAAQLFFFLRDVGHRHQHHDPNTDTIVDLHLTGDDDVQWRLDTLFNMYRKIITYKRGLDRRDIPSALGVLAYAKTFRRVAKAELSRQNFDLIPEFYDAEMRESIEAKQVLQTETQGEGSRNRDFALSMILGGLALILSIVSVGTFSDHDWDKVPHRHLVWLIDNLVTQPLITVAVISALIWTLFHIFSENRLVNYKIAKFLTSLFHSASQKAHSIIFVFMSVFFFALFFVVLAPNIVGRLASSLIDHFVAILPACFNIQL